MEIVRETRECLIAEEVVERRSRYHSLEHQVDGELEDAYQERREDDELRDVVEGETEEPVEVPRPDPARGARACGRRRSPDGRSSARGRSAWSVRRGPSTTRGSRDCRRRRGTRTPWSGRGGGGTSIARRTTFLHARRRRPARPRSADRRAWRARSGNSRASERLPGRFRPRTRRQF